eukprot:COSAG01_NODE_44594_length_417_cov_1.405660_1_plen_59_part_10
MSARWHQLLRPSRSAASSRSDPRRLLTRRARNSLGTATQTTRGQAYPDSVYGVVSMALP